MISLSAALATVFAFLHFVKHFIKFTSTLHVVQLRMRRGSGGWGYKLTHKTKILQFYFNIHLQQCLNEIVRRMLVTPPGVAVHDTAVFQRPGSLGVGHPGVLLALEALHDRIHVVLGDPLMAQASVSLLHRAPFLVLWCLHTRARIGRSWSGS